MYMEVFGLPNLQSHSMSESARYLSTLDLKSLALERTSGIFAVARANLRGPFEKPSALFSTLEAIGYDISITLDR